MKHFNFSTLILNTAAVKHEAAPASVAITERNTPRFVLMAVEGLEALTTRAKDSRQAYEVRDMPAEDADVLLAALDREPPPGRLVFAHAFGAAAGDIDENGHVNNNV
jgi:PHD/YefM family antitoxin component YafN of YafNO toxin-antitoxin module